MKIEQDEMITKKYKAPIKTTTIVSILIAITLIIVIGIIIVMLSMKESKLVLTVDGNKTSYTEDTFLFTEGTRDIYVSIRDIAPLVGYDSHNR